MYLQEAVDKLNDSDERKKYGCPDDATLVIHLCHCRDKVWLIFVLLTLDLVGAGRG